MFAGVLPHKNGDLLYLDGVGIPVGEEMRDEAATGCAEAHDKLGEFPDEGSPVLVRRRIPDDLD